MSVRHGTSYQCAMLIAAGLVLGACKNTLVYAERTSLDIAAVRVNATQTTPLQVDIGLHRTIAGIAPPTAEHGEAPSMISGFRVEYERGTANTLAGNLTIKSRFASGQAATNLADTPVEAKALMAPTMP